MDVKSLTTPILKQLKSYLETKILFTAAKHNIAEQAADLVFASAKKYDESELIISKLDSTVCDTKMCTSDFIGRHVDELIGKPVSTALPAGDRVEVCEQIGKPIQGMPKPGTIMGLSTQDKPPKQGTDLVKLAQDNALRNTGVQPARLNNDKLGDNISQPGPQIVACANCKSEFVPSNQTFQRKNYMDFNEVASDALHKCPSCSSIICKADGAVKYPPQKIDFSLNCPNCTSRNWRVLKDIDNAADVKCMQCDKNYNLQFGKPDVNPLLQQLAFMREGSTTCPQCANRIPYSTTSAVENKPVTCSKCNLHFAINLKKAENRRMIERANEFISQEENQQIGTGVGNSTPSYSSNTQQVNISKASVENLEESKKVDQTMKNQPVQIRQNQQITDVMAKQNVTPDNKETKQLKSPDNPLRKNDLPMRSPAGALYLVRHGKTALNSEDTKIDNDRIRGWKNIPLDKEGRLQAKELGQIFKGKKIDKLYSSDLQRAYDTANEISKGTGTPVNKKFDLRPWNLGKHQGQSSKMVGPEIESSITKTPNLKVDGGESFNNFKTRALNMARKLIEEAKTKKVVAVTHTRDLKLIQAWIKAGCPEDNSIDVNEFMNDSVKTGSIHKVEPTDNGIKVTKVENLNNSSIDNDTTVSSNQGGNTSMETKPEEVKNEVPTIEVVVPVVDETPAEDTTVADVDDAEAIEQEELLEVSKTLKAEDRNTMSNKDFAVVKTVKDKKTGGTRTIRKYPIKDKAHVQNALARLNQKPSRDGLRKLGVSPETVINKVKAAGHKMGMEVADMDKCCTYSSEMEKAEMEGYCVSSQGTDMQKVVKRGKDNMQDKTASNSVNDNTPNSVVVASKESTPDATVATSKIKKVKTGDSAVQGLTPDQVNQMQNQLFANMNKAIKFRKAHKATMKNIKALKKAMSEGCFASVQEVDVVMNMDFTSPGKTTVDNRGTGEKVSEAVVTGDQAGLTPVSTTTPASVETEAKELADALKPAKIGEKVDVIIAPAAPVVNMDIPGKGEVTPIDNRGTGEKVSEAITAPMGTGSATEVPSLNPGKTQETAVNMGFTSEGKVTTVDDRGTGEKVSEGVANGPKGDGSDTIVRAQIEEVKKENESLKLKIQELETAAIKVAERKKVLGEFGKDLSDKDILDDGKFELASQKAEQAKLKKELNKSSIVVAEIESTMDGDTLKKLRAEIDAKAFKKFGK